LRHAPDLLPATGVVCSANAVGAGWIGGDSKIGGWISYRSARLR
jgi:hypothetical protein